MTDEEKLKKLKEIACHHMNSCKSENAVFDAGKDFGIKLMFELVEQICDPKPRYKIEQTVWRLNDEDMPQKIIIDGITFDDDMFLYSDGSSDWWIEEQLYPNRQSLIKSQIDHWTTLLSQDCES